jgi:hypothetical protein
VQGTDASSATDLASVWGGLGVQKNDDINYCREGRQARKRVDLRKDVNQSEDPEMGNETQKKRLRSQTHIVQR